MTRVILGELSGSPRLAVSISVAFGGSRAGYGQRAPKWDPTPHRSDPPRLDSGCSLVQAVPTTSSSRGSRPVCPQYPSASESLNFLRSATGRSMIDDMPRSL